MKIIYGFAINTGIRGVAVIVGNTMDGSVGSRHFGDRWKARKVEDLLSKVHCCTDCENLLRRKVTRRLYKALFVFCFEFFDLKVPRILMFDGIWMSLNVNHS